MLTKFEIECCINGYKLTVFHENEKTERVYELSNSHTQKECLKRIFDQISEEESIT